MWEAAAGEDWTHIDPWLTISRPQHARGLPGASKVGGLGCSYLVVSYNFHRILPPSSYLVPLLRPAAAPGGNNLTLPYSAPIPAVPAVLLLSRWLSAIAGRQCGKTANEGGLSASQLCDVATRNTSRSMIRSVVWEGLRDVHDLLCPARGRRRPVVTRFGIDIQYVP